MVLPAFWAAAPADHDLVDWRLAPTKNSRAHGAAVITPFTTDHADMAAASRSCPVQSDRVTSLDSGGRDTATGMSFPLGEYITGWASLERVLGLVGPAEPTVYLRGMRGRKSYSPEAFRLLGVPVDPDAMFDIQIKHIHEYMRQYLDVLQTIAHWHAIRDNPNGDRVPRVKIFGGKTAPGYLPTKEIAHLINSVAEVLNADPVTNPFLKGVYLPDYTVTTAKRMLPAADLIEQWRKP